MKFERIIRAVYFQPWLIEASTHSSIRKLLDSRLAGEMLPMMEKEEVEDPEMQNGIKIINIHGVIGQRMSAMERACTGACDVGITHSELIGGLENPDVKAFFLSVDSPGGTVGGVAELADVILQVREVKPVMVFTDGMMCSAAYWLGSCGTAIYASKTSEVGSIGVYIPWVDETKAFEKAGYKADPIINSGGDFKAVGFPGTSLTDEQRGDLQSKVDQTFQMFKDHVMMCRPRISENALNGKVFMGEQAKKMGLVDEIGTFADAYRDIQNPSFS